VLAGDTAGVSAGAGGSVVGVDTGGFGWGVGCGVGFVAGVGFGFGLGAGFGFGFGAGFGACGCTTAGRALLCVSTTDTGVTTRTEGTGATVCLVLGFARCERGAVRLRAAAVRASGSSVRGWTR
jgi:hypothetical protein